MLAELIVLPALRMVRTVLSCFTCLLLTVMLSGKSDKPPMINVNTSRSAEKSKSTSKAEAQNPKSSADSFQSNKARRGSPPDASLRSNRQSPTDKYTLDQDLASVGTKFK